MIFYARFWASRLKDIVFCLHFSIFNAVVSLSKCARRCIFVPLEKAVYCATESPRKYLGLEIPALSVGYDASFNVVDERGKVTEVYSKGKKVL